jgi:hypothetical protein
MKMGNEIKVGAVVYGKAGINKSRQGLNIEEGVITKVGRKYFEVKFRGFETYKYEIKTLNQKTEYATDYYFYFSKQEILDERELVNTIDKIRSVIGSYGTTRINLDQAKAILKIINVGVEQDGTKQK